MTLAAKLFPCDPRPIGVVADRWDRQAAERVRSVDDAIALLPTGGSDRDYALAANELLRTRFFHGYSRLRFCDNWVASLASLVWSDLNAPVRPQEILKYRRAACSQQAIVFQELMRRRGLATGSVRMTGHFVPAARIDGEWMAFDSNKETRPRMFPVSALQHDDAMYRWIYPDPSGPRAGTARLTDIDRNPALQATQFQQLAQLFSNWGWLILLALYVVLERPWRRRRQKAPSGALALER